MVISLNGDPYEIAGPLTVSQLLEHLAIDPRRVAVEHNLVVLKRATFDTVVIHEGDQVEIVNFVGGGSHGLRRRSVLKCNEQPVARSGAEAL